MWEEEGVVLIIYKQERCSFCEGRGYYDNPNHCEFTNGMSRCPICKGLGSVTIREEPPVFNSYGFDRAWESAMKVIRDLGEDPEQVIREAVATVEANR